MSPPAESRSLRDTKELLGLMIDAVEDYAIYMLDVDGTVISWNSGAQRCKGYSAAEIVGRNYACFFPVHEIIAGEPQKRLADAKRYGRLRSEGWRIRKDGSKFWAVVTSTAVRDKQDRVIGFAQITRDLTDRRDKENKLQDAIETAEHANKAKSDFLAHMSHELRTPLNAILGFSEMMLSEISGPLGTKNREYAGHVLGSANHLLALINDVLDLAKLDAEVLPLEFENTDLRSIALEAVETVQPLANKGGIDILVDVSHPIPLRCDSRRILQILLNLLSNAVKFTLEGGRVTLSVIEDVSSITILVEDTGIGMDADEIPQALSRFGQIESVMARNFQGTGLGLPLVKQLVKLHGGSFELSSEKFVGTRATLTFLKSGPAL